MNSIIIPDKNRFPLFFYKPLKILFHPDYFKYEEVLQDIFGERIRLIGSIYSLKKKINYYREKLEIADL